VSSMRARQDALSVGSGYEPNSRTRHCAAKGGNRWSLTQRECLRASEVARTPLARSPPPVGAISRRLLATRMVPVPSLGLKRLPRARRAGDDDQPARPRASRAARFPGRTHRPCPGPGRVLAFAHDVNRSWEPFRKLQLLPGYHERLPIPLGAQSYRLVDSRLGVRSAHLPAI